MTTFNLVKLLFVTNEFVVHVIHFWKELKLNLLEQTNWLESFI